MIKYLMPALLALWPAQACATNHLPAQQQDTIIRWQIDYNVCTNNDISPECEKINKITDWLLNNSCQMDSSGWSCAIVPAQ